MRGWLPSLLRGVSAVISINSCGNVSESARIWSDTWRLWGVQLWRKGGYYGDGCGGFCGDFDQFLNRLHRNQHVYGQIRGGYSSARVVTSPSLLLGWLRGFLW